MKSVSPLRPYAFVCAALLSLAPARPASGQEERTVEVPKEIVRQLLSGDEGLRKYVRVRPDGTAENLVAVPLELNGGGEPELEVHGTGSICGAQNCVAWVFRKTARGYEMLLDADSVQTVKPQKTSTRGYRDIILHARLGVGLRAHAVQVRRPPLPPRRVLPADLPLQRPAR